MSATNKTPYYHLSQWLSTDSISHGDVNEDNYAIDAALRSLSTNLSTKASASSVQTITQNLASKGYVMAESGSYVGTGGRGVNAKNTLTFTSAPKVVFIFNAKYGITRIESMSVWWGATTAPTTSPATGTSYTNSCQFEGKSMKWCTDTDFANVQLNTTGTTYCYFALRW